MYRLFKRFASIVAYRLGFWSLVFRVSYRIEKKPILIAFVFHRIVANGPPHHEFVKPYEIGRSQEEFEKEIAQIERWFDVINLHEFRQIVTGQVSPNTRRPLALLTFDDADADHLKYAFPVLARRGLPALVFVPTGFIDTGRHFYHVSLTNLCNNFTNEIWQQVRKTCKDDLIRAILDKYEPDFANNKKVIRIELGKILPNMPYQKRDRLLQDWESLIGGKYDLGIRHMTWDEICGLAQSHIDIGSHTVNHNRLVQLDSSEQIIEMVESKEVLESRLSRPIFCVAYPEGFYNNDTVEAARRAGYELGFSVDRGTMDYPRAGDDLLRLSRIGTGRGAPDQICLPVGKFVTKRLLKMMFVKKP